MIKKYKEILPKLKELYSSGKTHKEISSILEIPFRSVQYLIRNNSIKTKGRGNNPNSRAKSPFTLDYKVFSYKSLETYYWAGFLAADGNIYKNQLTLCLQKRDTSHLLKFKGFLKTTQNLNFRKNGHPVLKISNYNICKDLLKNFKITPKKSLTLQFPVINNDNLTDAFIIGYIDGDGCVIKNKIDKNDYLRISILGTQEFLQSIKNRFDKILKKHSANIKKYGNIYSIVLTGKKANHIFNYFIKLDVPKLERKWDYNKFEHIFKRQNNDIKN